MSNKSQQLTSVSTNGSSGGSGFFQMVETDLERDEQTSMTSAMGQPEGMKNGIIRVEEHEANDFVTDAILDDAMTPIVTDELNPSVRNKVIRLIKDFILFPTRTRVILSLLTLIWLAYCWSMITFGLTNDHYCPAQPKLSQTIAIHGGFWVFICCYVIFRLIWSEISPGKQPTCSCFVGNPPVRVDWKKEYTYGVDFFVMLLLLTSYIYNMAALVTLLDKKPHLVHAPHRHWLTKCERTFQTDNCCRRFLVEYAISQQVISYLGMAVLVVCYLYVMGFLDFIQSRLCFKRTSRGASQAETAPLI